MFTNRNNVFFDNLDKYTQLDSSERVNTGKKSVILASCATATEGVFGIGEYSYWKHMANRIKNSPILQEKLRIPSKWMHIILQATADDLYNCVQDRKVENIIVIWHANYETWVSRTGSVANFSIGDNANDHLKKWVFVNAWCANTFKDTYFPLGTFCMKDRDNLLWAPEGELMYTSTFKKWNFTRHKVYLQKFLQDFNTVLYKKMIEKSNGKYSKRLKKETILL